MLRWESTPCPAESLGCGKAVASGAFELAGIFLEKGGKVLSEKENEVTNNEGC